MKTAFQTDATVDEVLDMVNSRRKLSINCHQNQNMYLIDTSFKKSNKNVGYGRTLTQAISNQRRHRSQPSQIGKRPLSTNGNCNNK